MIATPQRGWRGNRAAVFRSVAKKGRDVSALPNSVQPGEHLNKRLVAPGASLAARDIFGLGHNLPGILLHGKPFLWQVRRRQRQGMRFARASVGLRWLGGRSMKLSLVVLTPGKMEGKSIPVTLSQFLIGRDELRYELVVNSVEKDRIRGYISAPKDKVLSAEGPKLRGQ